MRISDWSSDVCSSDLILRVLGIEALATYLVKEIQDVYRLQGVTINDKHIEVIVRQMLQKVEISDPAETTFLIGEVVDKIEFEQVNAKARSEGLKEATATPVLQGITKASLQRSEEHTSELQSLMRISYAVFCLKKK